MNNIAVLTEKLKAKLAITWEDTELDTRLKDIISSAIPDLIEILGITDEKFDFEEAGIENTLLINYCFYEFNNALADFEDNYSEAISRCRKQWEIKSFLAEKEGESK